MFGLLDDFSDAIMVARTAWNSCVALKRLVGPTPEQWDEIFLTNQSGNDTASESAWRQHIFVAIQRKIMALIAAHFPQWLIFSNIWRAVSEEEEEEASGAFPSSRFSSCPFST